MAADKSKTGQDRKEISLNEDYEVRDWTKALGVTEEELRAAVVPSGRAQSRFANTSSAKTPDS